MRLPEAESSVGGEGTCGDKGTTEAAGMELALFWEMDWDGAASFSRVPLRIRPVFRSRVNTRGRPFCILVSTFGGLEGMATATDIIR